MAVLAVLCVTLEVPDLGPGIEFYSNAGMVCAADGQIARIHCQGREESSIVLLGGFARKRLHHVSLLADDLDVIASRTTECGGKIVPAPQGFDEGGLWITDPHGMLINLVDRPAEAEPAGAERAFQVNGPGRLVRVRQSGVLPHNQYEPAKPLRLGHILVFTPDVMRSVDFVTTALGMGLADHAQDVIAFTCARKTSDHHVIAFAKSPGVGFHHASFLLNDPDEVGRAGRRLANRSKRGDWGFGRHTIGSNFFHYIQDPWGSWFEYYSDMDHIDDYELWNPTNYAMEDSLASWGPTVPTDFVHNYEVVNEAFVSDPALQPPDPV